ncbi:hypothetical protein [Deinococcus roseus]|uniref:Uncharacterized protein n=1 Tax=Deinococcus roseus TaxID=392414 RepID=A0ABQ2D9I0_9DEIO|nr:hypothetical protein [Deinococcus roseus]GGJ48138.1 hypothetical protein GCM10008938_37700 [Deinococcus roseus]
MLKNKNLALRLQLILVATLFAGSAGATSSTVDFLNAFCPVMYEWGYMILFLLGVLGVFGGLMAFKTNPKAAIPSLGVGLVFIGAGVVVGFFMKEAIQLIPAGSWKTTLTGSKCNNPNA